MNLKRVPKLQDGDLVVMTYDPIDSESWYDVDDSIAAVARAIREANPHLTTGGTLLALPKGMQLRRVDEEVMRRAGWVRA